MLIVMKSKMLSHCFGLILFSISISYVRCGIKPGFPCERIPNFCERVNCMPVDNCPNGEMVNGGGNCGCCPICVTYQELDDQPCDETDTEHPVFDTDFIGLTYKYDKACHPGLICTSNKCAIDKNGQIDNGQCLYHQSEADSNEWEVKPECDYHGYFDFKRNKGRDTPRTFCVDKDGDTIFGRIPTGSVNTTCSCSRLVNELKDPDLNLPLSIIGNIRCDELGDFTSLQCWKGVCFCVDPYTREIITPAIPMSGMSALPCYNDTTYGDGFYTPCQKEVYKMKAIIEELENKGITGILIQLPECDFDGSYSPMQYDGNRQICATRDGNQIGSYIHEGVPFVAMNCHCARDGTYPDGLPNSYRFDDCANVGDYNPQYSVGVDYYCLDSDGQQSSDHETLADGQTCTECAPCAPP